MRITKIFISLLLIAGCSGKVKYYLPYEYNMKRVHSGLEIFIKKYAKKYAGKKAIVVTNHSGVDFYLNSNIKLLREKGICISIVMAPEHGLYGYQNEFDNNLYNNDSERNLIIYNLHKLDNNSLKLLLKSVDIIIFDIQDMGMRCYTYISNLKIIMDVMAGMKNELIVLDRPNPIGFLETDGAYLEKKFTTKYISAFPGPFLYNMTIGESALYYNKEFKKNINLRVIEMKNYYREMLYNETSLPWVPPSPNLPTYESSIIYSAVVLMEGINISIGRGTAKPFEYIGAPWIEPISFCKRLEKLGLKNFKFRPVYFEPTFSKYVSQRCGGAQIFYVGGKFSPTEISYKIIQFIMKNYKSAEWKKYKTYFDIDPLAGTNKFRKAIDKGLTYEQFKGIIDDDIKKYQKRRKRYLMYY